MTEAVGYGILTYPSIPNIGDWIQSFAARQFLPRIDYEIERERLGRPPMGDGPIRLILNGWFMHDAAQWPPHARIQPLPISMHFVRPGRSRLRRWARTPLDRMLGDAGGEYLRRHSPIGARDRQTLGFLQEYGIPSYLSGCLTLALRPFSNVQRLPQVIACDLSPCALGALQNRCGLPVATVTHTQAMQGSVSGFAAAERMLRTYQSAHAVVTSRVHVALPCLALGVPVLLVCPKPLDGRIAGAADLVHSCTEDAFVSGRYDYDVNAPPANPDQHRQLAMALTQRCVDFVSKPAAVELSAR